MTVTPQTPPVQPSASVEDDDLRLLLMIRHFELKLLELFDQGGIHGTTHTCLGQEYIPVALHPMLHDRDFVFSNHRGHGHYLARYQDLEGLLAEIMGRQGAVCHGVGGSQHILRERYLSTGVQGQSLPVAVGMAMRLAAREPGRLACVYIGDGTWGEGAVYEALNMAALWRLPLLVVVENNGVAQSTPTEHQLAGTVADRAGAFGIDHHRTDAIDLAEIRAALAPRIERVRRGDGPLVAEFATHRVGPHSKGDDTRPPEALRQALAHDWYALLAAGGDARFAAFDAAARERIDELAADIATRPLSQWNGS
ncbi:thiamine pyrophosphate-dependent dehydrogenase E1 component subunit alpha [Spongiactinospora sp. 9N601]|uniref:thiamine pyrophosphate-dependent dehydrogenase E1 component subunit alpha n=1 Tax=Spongiactinospora sp. 9N601 TaxID=3375149 RepID=UPI0037B1BD70